MFLACSAARPHNRKSHLMLLFLEQLLNGVQLGVTLLLMASGLTLVFGIMNLINLAHGSLFMVGAYVAATVSVKTGSFLLGLLAGTAAAGVTGMIVEFTVIRRLYERGPPRPGFGDLRAYFVFQ